MDDYLYVWEAQDADGTWYTIAFSSKFGPMPAVARTQVNAAKLLPFAQAHQQATHENVRLTTYAPVSFRPLSSD